MWRYLLNAKQMTGGMLALGPLVGFVFYMLSPLGITGGLSSDPTTQETLMALGGDSAWAGVSMLIASIGLLLWTAAMAAVRFSMAGGAGDQYVNVGLVSLVLGLALFCASNALIAGAADSAAIAQGAGMGAAAAMWGGSEAIGTFGGLFWGVGLLMFGYGWILQKNVQTVMAAIAVILGILAIVVTFVDLNSTVQSIIWLVFTLWAIALGITRITASD